MNSYVYICVHAFISFRWLKSCMRRLVTWVHIPAKIAAQKVPCMYVHPHTTHKSVHMPSILAGIFGSFLQRMSQSFVHTHTHTHICMYIYTHTNRTHMTPKLTGIFCSCTQRPCCIVWSSFYQLETGFWGPPCRGCQHCIHVSYVCVNVSVYARVNVWKCECVYVYDCLVA